MPRYSFSLEDGTRLTHPDATEDFADNAAAMTHASEIARDFSGSTAAVGRSNVVVRDATGSEIGRAPILNAIR